MRKTKRGKRRVVEDRERQALELATEGRGLAVKDIAARTHLSKERVERLLGPGTKALAEGEVMEDTARTVKLVDSATNEPVNIPGGVEHLRSSPDWRKGSEGVWRYVGPYDEHGYPQNERWLAERFYEKRLADHQERFDRLLSTQEGSADIEAYMAEHDVDTETAINRLAGKPPQEPVGQQGVPMVDGVPLWEEPPALQAGKGSTSSTATTDSARLDTDHEAELMVKRLTDQGMSEEDAWAKLANEGRVTF